MAKPENRVQLMEYFGATQKNIMWSWCAVNEEEKSVYLSVWTDYKGDFENNNSQCYIIQEPDWGVNPESGSKSAARNDHDEKLSKIFNENYAAFGYFVEAKDKNATVREIEHTKTSFIFELNIKKLSDGTVIGYPTKRIEVK